LDWDSLSKLFEGFTGIGDDPRLLAMMAIGCVLLYLGIKRNFEPLLLVGIGSGVILANLRGHQDAGDLGRRSERVDEHRHHHPGHHRGVNHDR
jgi:Na+-transporting methylmalonyl-CoA/oxaloacetate decarboxylase beta subunit